jgi:hypothetical protein
MLSLYIGPKVITLSSFHCSNVFFYIGIHCTEIRDEQRKVSEQREKKQRKKEKFWNKNRERKQRNKEKFWNKNRETTHKERKKKFQKSLSGNAIKKSLENLEFGTVQGT